ncbi:MAG: hypothetical protein M1828_003733 [Chrysothrix sp. TS-e1954]|nr:MAG: hypothetical protein M1828_003733 [Chrysothrix sp. TS-e1954]
MAEGQRNTSESDSPASAVQSIETPHQVSNTFHDTSNVTSQRGNGQAAAAQHHLNPRSCVTCRKRKVRCDKRNPCSNCTKAHIECIFPAPGRAPRKPRKPPDSELLARLRKLEGVVQSLGGSTDDVPHSPSSFAGTTLGRQGPAPLWESTDGSHDDARSATSSDQAKHNAQADWAADHHRTSLDSNFGRLVLNEGKSRYINGNYWANLSNEVEDLKEILHNSTESDEDDVSPGTSTPGSPSHHGFMFGPSRSSKDLHRLHPPPPLFEEYWEIFDGHVNQLVKMLHRPTMKHQILALKDDPSNCTKGMEALLFAIYFSAITSSSPEECQAISGEARDVLVSRYRHATEEALARAHFLVTEELIVLQALIIFLLGLRLHEDPRHIWSLTGLVVRIAVTMGLHRDGTNFNLSPFEVETRRRMWWQVCILDVRLSEDHGCDPSIIEHTSDTRFPLNINDDDISPTMTESPPGRTGITEMTFCLIRFEVTRTFRRLSYNPPGSGPVLNDNLEVTIQDKERWIEECHQRLEENYLKYCDMSCPMHWVICTVARLVMAKMWLQIYQPFQRIDSGAILPAETRDRLFITSLESIEYNILLATESRTFKWGWLFKTYSQWHALAFLLSELCHRTKGPTVMRAWRAVDCTIAPWGSRHNAKSQMWRPLRKLLAKARAAREREVALDNTTYDSQQTGAGQGATSEDPDYGLSPLVPTKSVTMTDDPKELNAEDQAQTTTTSQGDPLSTSLFDPAPGIPHRIDMPSQAFQLNPANTKPYASSPFFANQPQIQPGQWGADYTNPYMNSNFVNEILLDDPTFQAPNYTSPPFMHDPASTSKPDMPTDAQAGVGAPFTLDSTLTSSNSLPILNSSLPPLSNTSTGMVKDQYRSFSDGSANPMLTGSGSMPNGEDDVAWQEWDDMVREFELENGNGNLQAGGRRPMQGVPWF